jgi:hypothetical protein
MASPEATILTENEELAGIKSQAGTGMTSRR